MWIDMYNIVFPGGISSHGHVTLKFPANLSKALAIC